jgi:hypothetical protein
MCRRAAAELAALGALYSVPLNIYLAKDIA